MAALAVAFVLLGSSMASAAEHAVVANVTGTPHNGAISLSWDAVADEDGNPVKSYEVSWGLYSVLEGLADVYDNTADTGSKDTSYVLRNLTNGVRYYISVKAVFENGEKSYEYSNEIVVTPSSVYSNPPGTTSECGSDNGEAPVVQEAKALTKNLVKITFSECVVLPDVLPELSFQVNDANDETVSLSVEKAEYKVDYAGETNEKVHKDIAFVTLSTPQVAGSSYKVTVSASIQDEFENPIESGVTDTAFFTGTDATEIPEGEKPLFSAPVVDPEHGAAEEDDDFVLPPVDENPDEGTDVPPTDEGTADETNPDEPVVIDEAADTTAPENVTDFTITSTARITDYLLSLKWLKSISEDVDHQTVYESLTKGTDWNNGKSLDKTAESYETAGKPETEYTYKVTATDAAGNENAGSIQSVRLPALAQTGAPVVLLALGAVFAFMGTKKMKNK